MMKKICLISLSVLLFACAKQTANIQEKAEIFATYPFSDPDAIPRPESNYYPYCRFDGYSHTSDSMAWKVVEMENEFIKVYIFPEIGGKIWGAIEKSTGNEFIYTNSVVKFRNISMRGPWTSGGIELNFGTIGHTPTTSTPVDYTTRKNPDGSVSCFVGAIDLVTRTRWEAEINLQPDKAFFTTNITWSNPTAFTQPYYQWCNVAFPAKGNLEMIFPGNYRLGHGGEAQTWPVDDEGRNLSFYANNSALPDQSNHIIGTTAGFYSAYWHDLNFGAGNYSQHGDKLGKKIFLWSQARSGGIWEDLLTDTDGQYVELQTGRLYNQAVGTSTQTPFKHRGFSPNSTDRFLEYWFPVMNIGGVVKANALGALNIVRGDDGNQTVYFSPLQFVNDEIKIYFGDELKYRFDVHLKPLEVWKSDIAQNSPQEPVTIAVGRDKELVYSENDLSMTSRPVTAPENFDWNSVFGLYTAGVNLVYQGDFRGALTSFHACLEKDSFFAPALNCAAELYLRRADTESACRYVRKALSINTYDPQANFLSGLVHKQTGNLTDAQDGFAVAALSLSYRTAAYIELAKLFILKNELPTAKLYAERVLNSEAANQDALLLLSVISRKSGKNSEAERFANKIEEISPLNHFSRFEKLLIKNDKRSADNFTSLIGNELPHETYCEMAAWYEYTGCYGEAIKLLETSPETALVNLMLSSLYHKINNGEKSDLYFSTMLGNSPDFVFPFRAELIPVLTWAVAKTDDWKPPYYLALLEWRLGDKQLAKEWFTACGQRPESPWFFLAKANLFRDDPDYDPGDDILKARERGMNEWRTCRALNEYYLGKKQSAQALATAKEALEKFPDNDIMKVNYAQSLLANGLYTETLKALENTVILPHEGATYGRSIYRKAALFEGLQFMKEKKFEQALESISKSRQWPENLGAGRPHNVNERIEDFLEAECRANLDGKAARPFREIEEYVLKNTGM
jgi:tetratricopeptide (TPR) repeat protein